MNSSELQKQYLELVQNEKANTPEQLDRLVALQDILTQRGELPNVNISKIKPWHYLVGGIAVGLLGTNMMPFGGHSPAFQQAQPIPNTVTVPAGSGAPTVFNFDND